jgi:hypothetical protein
VTRAIIAALTLALVPTVVEACAVCLDSAYGDRSFNRAFALFMLTPFAVAVTLAGVLARQLGVRRVARSARRANEASEGAGEGPRAERPTSS